MYIVERLKKILDEKQPYVVLLVGTPLTGKSTLLEKYFSNEKYNLISRDEILMEIAGTRNYNEAWNILGKVKGDGQKLVDKKLKKDLLEFSKNKENVIIDMTNLTPKGRKKHLSKFPKHFKAAIVFEFLSEDEYIARNSKREKEEGKAIGLKIIERMKQSYVEITDDEDFDLVVQVKDLNI